VKLVDFGIGKMTERGITQRLTRTGAVMGTVGYLAPEQLQNKATPASDLFALGVVLFEALTGRPPFDRASTIAVDAFSAAAPRIRDVMPELMLPPGLESLVASLLARVPEERPTASDVLAQLAKCKAPGGVSTAPLFGLELPIVAARQEPAAAPPARRSRAWAAAMIAIVSYAVVLTVRFSRGAPAPGPAEPAPSVSAAKVMVAAKAPDAPAPAVTAEHDAPSMPTAPDAPEAARPRPAKPAAPRALAPRATPAPSPLPPVPTTTVFSTLSTD